MISKSETKSRKEEYASGLQSILQNGPGIASVETMTPQSLASTSLLTKKSSNPWPSSTPEQKIMMTQKLMQRLKENNTSNSSTNNCLHKTEGTQLNLTSLANAQQQPALLINSYSSVPPSRKNLDSNSLHKSSSESHHSIQHRQSSLQHRPIQNNFTSALSPSTYHAPTHIRSNQNPTQNISGSGQVSNLISRIQTLEMELEHSRLDNADLVKMQRKKTNTLKTRMREQLQTCLNQIRELKSELARLKIDENMRQFRNQLMLVLRVFDKEQKATSQKTTSQIESLDQLREQLTESNAALAEKSSQFLEQQAIITSSEETIERLHKEIEKLRNNTAQASCAHIKQSQQQPLQTKDPTIKIQQELHFQQKNLLDLLRKESTHTAATTPTTTTTPRMISSALPVSKSNVTTTTTPARDKINSSSFTKPSLNQTNNVTLSCNQDCCRVHPRKLSKVCDVHCQNDSNIGIPTTCNKYNEKIHENHRCCNSNISNCKKETLPRDCSSLMTQDKYEQELQEMLLQKQQQLLNEQAKQYSNEEKRIAEKEITMQLNEELSKKQIQNKQTIIEGLHKLFDEESLQHSQYKRSASQELRSLQSQLKESQFQRARQAELIENLMSRKTSSIHPAVLAMQSSIAASTMVPATNIVSSNKQLRSNYNINNRSLNQQNVSHASINDSMQHQQLYQQSGIQNDYFYSQQQQEQKQIQQIYKQPQQYQQRQGSEESRIENSYLISPKFNKDSKKNNQQGDQNERMRNGTQQLNQSRISQIHSNSRLGTPSQIAAQMFFRPNTPIHSQNPIGSRVKF